MKKPPKRNGKRARGAPGGGSKPSASIRPKAGTDGGSDELTRLKQQRNLLEIQNEELARAHAALEVSNQRFADLHENAPVGYLTFDARGSILDMNMEAERLLSVRRTAAIGKPFIVYVEPGERTTLLDHFLAVRRSTSTVTTELQLATENGTVRHVRMSTNRHRHASGCFSLFLAAIEDITALTAASADKAYLASIIESSTDAIASFTLEGIVQSWNPGAEALFGYSTSEMIGAHISAIVPDAYRDEIVALFASPIDNVGFLPFETIRQRKDGSMIEVEASRSLIMGKGRVIAIAATWRNISERKRADAEIREAEGKLRAVLEGSADAAYRRNLQTDGYDYMSPVIERITGYTPGELGAQPLSVVLSFIHPADILHVKRTLEGAMAGHKPYGTLEYRFRCKDGSYRWLSESFQIRRDEAGKPLYLIGTVREVTDLKKMEAELREIQRLAQSTIEALPAQIAVIDGSGTILTVNEGWKRFARNNGGSQATCGIGTNYLTVCDNARGMEQRDAGRFTAGIRAVSKGRKEMFSIEYACHSPAQKRWFAGYVTPFSGVGEHRMVIAHVDVTAAKLAEERFREILESTPDAIIIVDSKGAIQMINNQAERLFGYTRRAMIGKKVEWLMPTGVKQEDTTHQDHYSEDPRHRPMTIGLEMYGRRKNGSLFPVEITLNPLQSEHGILTCAAIRDVTERKKGEDAIRKLNAELEDRVAERTASLLEANKSLQQAIEGRRILEQEVIEISEAERQEIGRDLHDDLGQQLAGLWMFTSALEKSLRSHSAPEADQAARISGMLDKALSITRSLARGLQPVMPESGGLMAALNELATRSSQLFKLRCRFTCRIPVNIHDTSAATCLYRIAQEAVTNAARHGKAKHISISLSSTVKVVKLSINDDGAGLKNSEGKHDGMGIRTMNYRAEVLGGSLIFSNRPGGGTSVFCKIPNPTDGGPKKQSHDK